MPSGKTHDAITVVTTVPVLAAGSYFAGFLSAAILTVGYLLGGLVFGPDLDTASKQYHRWGMFKSLWYPYQLVFKHRSRFSHGLILGTLIRVLYFAGVVTLVSFFLAFGFAVFSGGEVPGLLGFTRVWSRLGYYLRFNLGDYAFYFAFFGLWLGAASHTIADIAGTYIKTGRAKGLF